MTARLGRYRILEQLGEGGMGVVYLAEHELLGRLTALKVLHQDLYSRDPFAVEQFRRGALLAARINHPGVAQIFDFEHTADGTSYLAMEYVPGETLGARLRHDCTLPTGEAVRLLGAVADGVDHAHSLGILHRDLKPENVMLTRDGSVKLLDFGIALETTQPGSDDRHAWGTPGYMSPEQLLGERLGPASDIHALGSLMYEALTGRLPHRGRSAMSLLASKLTKRPKPVTALRHDAPDSLADVIARALAPEPAKRWPSARAFARAAADAMTALAESPAALTWGERRLTA
jgi:serine/threonine-protein kinase